MLTEKEKKAIEIFNDYANYLNKYNKTLTIVPEDKTYFYIILNLIANLQDEVIKLLKENRELTAITNLFNAYETPFTDKDDSIIITSKKYFANGYFKNKFISKDLIKNKIKKYYEYDKKYKTYTSDGRENFTFEYFYAKEFEKLLKEGENDEKLQ